MSDRGGQQAMPPSPPTPPRDHFFRNVSPVILLHIARFVHPYAVAETLPRINRVWYRTLTAAPISFAKGNLVHGLPSPLHLQTSREHERAPENLKKRAAQIFERCKFGLFLNFGKDAVVFLAGCDAVCALRELLLRYVRGKVPNAPKVTEVNAFLVAAMRVALLTASVNVLQMLLHLYEEKPDTFRDGIVFPVPEDAFTTATWLDEPESWKVTRILLSDLRSMTRRFRQLVASKVNFGANLPVFLDEFCSPYDSFESFHKNTFKDKRWGEKMKELLKVLIDNRIKLSLVDLKESYLLATKMDPTTDFHEPVQELVLYEEIGLELCRDGDDADLKTCLFCAATASTPDPDVVEGLLRLHEGRCCRHLSYPRVWESAFKNPDVRVVKLLLPFQLGFDEFNGRIDMKLDGEDFLLQLHSTMDCGIETRRNSMKCAIKEGWTRLIRALARGRKKKGEITVDDYRITSIQPEVIRALLSVLSPDAWEELVDFQGLLYDFGYRPYTEDLHQNLEDSILGFFKNKHIGSLLCNYLMDMPVGAIPNPTALKVFFADIKPHSSRWVAFATDLLRRVCLEETAEDD
ncbi:hypothetical protein HDU96_010306 [Phlyctochytrium bullatum]|nr:hypothetical protein HDU96_010306 [Phlyctochytrium bullatum]